MIVVKYRSVKRKPASSRPLAPAAVGLRKAWEVCTTPENTVRFYEDLGRSVISRFATSDREESS